MKTGTDGHSGQRGLSWHGRPARDAWSTAPLSPPAKAHGLEAHATRGFTLVELLVVIAIIGILAGMVIPNVVNYLQRGQMARAVSEVRSADTSLAAMLADSGRSSFRDFLSANGRAVLGQYSEYWIVEQAMEAQRFYNDMFYDLLKNGRNATFWAIDLSVKQKLGTSYMDIGLDPWNQQYNFWLGPYGTMPVFHRSYRSTEAADGRIIGYIYDGAAQNAANAEVPGNPAADDDVISTLGGEFRGYGFPAPRDKRTYIYSRGPNQLYDAFITAALLYNNDADFLGGGDDINNWDSEAGWDTAPR